MQLPPSGAAKAVRRLNGPPQQPAIEPPAYCLGQGGHDRPALVGAGTGIGVPGEPPTVEGIVIADPEEGALLQLREAAQERHDPARGVCVNYVKPAVLRAALAQAVEVGARDVGEPVRGHDVQLGGRHDVDSRELRHNVAEEATRHEARLEDVPVDEKLQTQGPQFGGEPMDGRALGVAGGGRGRGGGDGSPVRVVVVPRVLLPLGRLRRGPSPVDVELAARPHIGDGLT